MNIKLNEKAGKLKQREWEPWDPPSRIGTGMHAWLVFMKVFQALAGHAEGASGGQSWATLISAFSKRSCRRLLRCLMLKL